MEQVVRARRRGGETHKKKGARSLRRRRPPAAAGEAAMMAATLVYLSLVALLVYLFVRAFIASKLLAAARAEAPPAPTAAAVEDDPPLAVADIDSAVKTLTALALEDRHVDAGKLLRRVRHAQRASGRAAHNVTLRPGLDLHELAQRHTTCIEAFDALTSEHGGWELLAKTSTTATHANIDDRFSRARTSGVLPLPAHAVVAVLRETDLFHTWYPRCVLSRDLHKTGRTDRIFEMRQNHEIPLLGLFKLRLLLSVYAVDALEEHNCILACGRSVRPDEMKHIDCPDDGAAEGVITLELEALQLLIEPLAANSTRAVLQVAIRRMYKVPAPLWVLKLVISTVVSRIFDALVDVS